MYGANHSQALTPTMVPSWPFTVNFNHHHLDARWLSLMIIVFITWNSLSNWIPLLEGLYSSNPWKFEFSDFLGVCRNGTEDLKILDSETRRHGIFSRTLRFYYVASSPGHGSSSATPIVLLCNTSFIDPRVRKTGLQLPWDLLHRTLRCVLPFFKLLTRGWAG